MYLLLLVLLMQASAVLPMLVPIASIETLPQETLSEICWQILAAKPQSPSDQALLSSTAQRAQALLEIDVQTMVNFERVSKQMKDTVSTFKKNYQKKLPLLLTRRNNLFAHEYCAAECEMFFKNNVFTELIATHTDYYTKLYTHVTNLPENMAIDIPQKLLKGRGELILSYRCAAANKLCEYIHDKQNVVTKEALLSACNLDNYSIVPVDIGDKLEAGKDLAFLSELVTKNPAIVFDARGDTDYRLLHDAVQKKNKEAVNILSRHAINVQNKYGTTALICAEFNNNPEIVRILVENKANLDLQDTGGDTALICAEFNNNPEIARLLVENKANPDIQNNYGNTALILATSNNKNLEKVRFLIENKANLDIQNKYGDTALIDAAGNNRLEIVKVLVDNKANLNIQNNDGYTALTLAVYKDNPDVVRTLVDNKANLNIQNNDGDIALSIAKSKGYLGIVGILGGI